MALNLCIASDKYNYFLHERRKVSRLEWINIHLKFMRRQLALPNRNVSSLTLAQIRTSFSTNSTQIFD